MERYDLPMAKGYRMASPLKWVILFFISILVLSFTVAFGQNKFKLKPGAEGKLCLNCHDNFKEKLKSQFVHTPVKKGECSGCHNPHASSHGKLLAADPNKICYNCHQTVIPEKARSAHKVVLEGNCVKCHDPHASNNKFVLVKAGNELCFSCHKSIGETVAKVKFKHSPVEKGCLNCHDPHGSAKSDHLLNNDLISLCGSCHKTDRPAFVKQHMDYPVAKARCTSCHNAHGSDRAGILFDNVHQPVANKLCNQCHEAPTSPNPFGTKRPGFELCRGCHSNMMNETFNKNRVHWPLVDKVGCVSCHEPHASTQKKLLSADLKSLCGKCHPDTMEKQEKIAAIEKQLKDAGKKEEVVGITHPPVQGGDCTLCHSAHASDSVFLLSQPSVIDLCGTCHEWQKHTSHPIGDKVIDLRNKNLKVDCLSCHRSHGTGNKHLLPFPTTTDLCVQCHKQYKR